jgi:hypothetical protein
VYPHKSAAIANIRFEGLALGVRVERFIVGIGKDECIVLLQVFVGKQGGVIRRDKLDFAAPQRKRDRLDRGGAKLKVRDGSGNR